MSRPQTKLDRDECIEGLEMENCTLRSTVQWLRRENDTLRTALDRANNVPPSKKKSKRKGKAK